MNQQRSRRFRASKETAEKIMEVNKIRAKLEALGAILPPPKEADSHFDSNCITPVKINCFYRIKHQNTWKEVLNVDWIFRVLHLWTDYRSACITMLIIS